MKKLMALVGLALLTGLMATGAILHPRTAVAQEGEAAVALLKKFKIGLAISPVPLDLDEKTRSEKKKIGLGSYIVNAQALCAECHSCPTYESGHNPFDGVGDGKLNSATYLAGGVRLPPVSANLTPDSEGLPAGLSLAQFKQVISTGLHHDSDEVLEAMPWPFFRYMIDKDLSNIYAYLSAIPPAEEPETRCRFPGL